MVQIPHIWVGTGRKSTRRTKRNKEVAIEERAWVNGHSRLVMPKMPPIKREDGTTLYYTDEEWLAREKARIAKVIEAAPKQWFDVPIEYKSCSTKVTSACILGALIGALLMKWFA